MKGSIIKEEFFPLSRLKKAFQYKNSSGRGDAPGFLARSEDIYKYPQLDDMGLQPNIKPETIAI